MTCSFEYMCLYLSRMGTFVTLAEVLEARGSPLDEDEVWCLLLATTEALLDISTKGKHSWVLLPVIWAVFSGRIQEQPDKLRLEQCAHTNIRRCW